MTLPVLSLGQEDLGRGRCLTTTPGLCGMLFFGAQPGAFVGQFSIPDPDGLFNFRLNGSDSFPDPSIQFADIEDLVLGTTVEGATASVRPVPEPSSMLLITIGALAAGRSVRRSRAAQRAARS